MMIKLSLNYVFNYISQYAVRVCFRTYKPRKSDVTDGFNDSCFSDFFFFVFVFVFVFKLLIIGSLHDLAYSCLLYIIFCHLPLIYQDLWNWLFFLSDSFNMVNSLLRAILLAILSFQKFLPPSLFFFSFFKFLFTSESE